MYGFAKAAQCKNPSEEDFKKLKSTVELAKRQELDGIRPFHLDFETLQLTAFADATVASNKNMSSQLGYLLAFVDAAGNANILHYASRKSRHVARSLLVVEIFVLTSLFDAASTIRVSFDAVLGQMIDMKIYVNSKGFTTA